MAGIFIKIINMSISASWIVFAVLLLRFLLKKAPKWICVALWGIVGLRLIMPFSFKSIFSLIPSSETISMAPDSPRPHFDSGVAIVDDQINGYLQGHYFEGVTQPEGRFIDITTVFAVIWLAGILLLLAYMAISYLRIKRKLGTAIILRENIFQSESVLSPFVLGIIKPRIYLPFSISKQDAEHVIAHEKAHIQRKDHLWKPLGFLILTVHWFNPLMWLGYAMLCRDIELACDEKVVKKLNSEQKADYSQALLSFSISRSSILACPLAFGEVGVKDRVRSVLNYKRPAFWMVIVAIAVGVAVAICFLTDPKRELTQIGSQSSGSELEGVALEIVYLEKSAPDPYLTVKYKNSTGHSLVFGNQHYVYQRLNDNWEDCRIGADYYWHTIAYSLLPGASMERSYQLSDKLMSQPGEYRFETDFFIEGDHEAKYKLWIEFELEEGVEGITVHTFKPIELVYDDGMYSFVQTAEDAPTYMLVNGMQLIEKTNGTVSEPIGTFEEITLNKDSFDSRFRGPTDYSWLANDTLKSLKDNNKRIWQLQSVFNAESPHLYILLEQKDGTFYLGFGYYSCNSNDPANPDDSHIRWLYKLEEISLSDVGSSDSNTVQAFESCIAYANYAESNEIYLKALNLSKMYESKSLHLPIYKLDTLKDLEQFKSTFGSIFTMDSGYNEVPSFNSATKKYDNAFFEENSLMLIYVSANNGTHRFKIKSINSDGGNLYAQVVETTKAEAVDTAMSGWLLTAAVPKSITAECEEFDAILISEERAYEQN